MPSGDASSPNPCWSSCTPRPARCCCCAGARACPASGSRSPGSLRPGEAPLDAARRELVEETGLDPDGLVDCHRRRHFPIHPAWRARYAPEVGHNTEHEFHLRPAGARGRAPRRRASTTTAAWLATGRGRGTRGLVDQPRGDPGAAGGAGAAPRPCSSTASG
ncbi:MAG: NUDIX domain-containing protein [Halofilum sp. (in: g-proteobacteria)]|nr:NUDIX domain-containing protein [Halofilum sp. (in: g-proteobacteria)]